MLTSTALESMHGMSMLSVDGNVDSEDSFQCKLVDQLEDDDETLPSMGSAFNRLFLDSPTTSGSECDVSCVCYPAESVRKHATDIKARSNRVHHESKYKAVSGAKSGSNHLPNHSKLLYKYQTRSRSGGNATNPSTAICPHSKYHSVHYRPPSRPHWSKPIKLSRNRTNETSTIRQRETRHKVGGWHSNSESPWICPQCTFLNEDLHCTRCMLCLTGKPPHSRPSSAPDIPSIKSRVDTVLLSPELDLSDPD